MVVTELPMVSDTTLVHIIKAARLMTVTELPMTILVSALHSANALLPMLVTVSLMVIDTIDAHRKKARSGTLVHEGGVST